MKFKADDRFRAISSGHTGQVITAYQGFKGDTYLVKWNHMKDTTYEYLASVCDAKWEHETPTALPMQMGFSLGFDSYKGFMDQWAEKRTMEILGLGHKCNYNKVYTGITHIYNYCECGKKES